MKNLYVLTLLLIGVTSCSKDGLDPVVDQAALIQKSEILITISSINYDYTGQCGNGCGTEGTVSYLANARANIYPGQVADNDKSLTPIRSGKTDSNGSILFRDINPGQYTVVVETDLGHKSRLLFTKLNERSYLEFSF